MPKLPNNKRRKYVPPKEPKKPGSNQDFYNKHRWRKVSRAFRRNFPLCQVCAAMDIIEEARVTDHIIAISQGGAPWNGVNHMSMCHTCHNRKRGLEAHTKILVEWEFDFNNEKVPVDRDEIIRVLCEGK